MKKPRLTNKSLDRVTRSRSSKLRIRATRKKPKRRRTQKRRRSRPWQKSLKILRSARKPARNLPQQIVKKTSKMCRRCLLRGTLQK